MNELLIESLHDQPIGQTKSFTWLATPIGIAAICREKQINDQPPFEEAIKEGIEVCLDLSREEKEFHQIKEEMIILFYS